MVNGWSLEEVEETTPKSLHFNFVALEEKNLIQLHLVP